MAPLKAILAGFTIAGSVSALPRPILESNHHDHEDLAMLGRRHNLEPRPMDLIDDFGRPARPARVKLIETFPVGPGGATHAPSTSLVTDIHTSYLHLTTSPSFGKPTAAAVSVVSVTAASPVAVSTVVEVESESVLLTASASSLVSSPVPTVNVTATAPVTATTTASSNTPNTTTSAFPMTSAPAHDWHESCDDAGRAASYYNTLIYTDSEGDVHLPPPSWGRVMPGACGPRRFSARDEAAASLVMPEGGDHLAADSLHHSGPIDDTPEARESARSWLSEYQRTRETTVYTTLVQGTASIRSIVTIQTAEPVPTTMVTETAAAVPTPPIAELPVGLPGPPPMPVPEPRECPTWGCGEMPCMGGDCEDREHPGPLPAPVSDPGSLLSVYCPVLGCAEEPCMGRDCLYRGIRDPREAAPYHSGHPGRHFDLDRVDCPVGGCEPQRWSHDDHVHCLSMNCDTPIHHEENECISESCAEHKRAGKPAKGSVNAVGTGPMEVEQA